MPTIARVQWEIDIEDNTVFMEGTPEGQALKAAKIIQAKYFSGVYQWVFFVTINDVEYKVDLATAQVTRRYG